MNESLLGSSTPDPVVTNHAPVASAADQTVTGPATVTLDGSASTDPDGDALTCQNGPRFLAKRYLTNSTKSEKRPSLLGAVTNNQTLAFRLTVTDPKGLSSSTADVQVVNKAPGKANQAPVVNQMQNVTLEAWSDLRLNVQAADPRR